MTTSDRLDRLKELSPAKRALLLQKAMRKDATAADSRQSIPRRAQHSPVPLSFAQQRLWFLNQLTPGSVAYNLPTALRLTGQLDPAALRHSFNAIIRRHEALRTTFTMIDEQPMQVIDERLELALPLVDLRSLPETVQQGQLGDLASATLWLPFDLERGPLVRITLVRLADEAHVLLLVMHHIVSDGWSMSVLTRELIALYAARVAGMPASLPELRIQYPDFAIWQREQLQGELLEQHLTYWRRQLGGSLPTLELPLDRPRPAVQTSHGAAQALDIAPQIREALRALNMLEDTTIFMALVAAFQALLHRYSGQDDIIVGTPIANRDRSQTEGLIGFFVNSLALRVSFAGDPSFRTLLRRVRDVMLDAYTYQGLPFEKLIEALNLPRDLSRHPLFQVMFVLQNTPPAALDLAGLAMQLLAFGNHAAKFDLQVTLNETDAGLGGGVEYNTDLFDDATIIRLVGHFQTLLAGALADPDQPVSALPLLSAAERAQLLAWNAAATTYAPDRCLHELFAAQAARIPDAIALIFEGSGVRGPGSGVGPEQVTYRELNRRANQLAHHLQALGVGPERLVGILMERSVELVVGLLGILKAGGAYLPLDPSYPTERLAFMLEDAQVSVLITTKDDGRRTMDDGLQSDSDIVYRLSSIVYLDADWPAIARQPATTPASGATPDNLAYMIYTSGSTGRPKGVLVSHANVARLFAATADWFHFGERDIWTLFHSTAFDFSVWELWGALGFGGRLVVVPYAISRSPEEFVAQLRSAHVTVLNQTPSAFRQLIAAEQAESEAGRLDLRLVIFGGEALELQSLAPWYARHDDQQPQLVNMYGITETTVHVTYRALTQLDLGKWAGSVIGTAIPDLSVYVLDRRMQLAAIGVPGELFVGGAGVARGYLNRPDLTAERFVPNPFADLTPCPLSCQERGRGGEVARLYKTGDLARYLANGSLEYLGRIDQQVKIRGFRIELGEIAAVLAQHPAVADSVVLAHEDAPGERRLVAYVVEGSGVRGQGSGSEDRKTSRQADKQTEGRGTIYRALPNPEPRTLIPELRAFLIERLPDYMVPAAWVLLDALPLTSNGKLDRAALPAPDGSRTALDGAYVAPRSAIEAQLAEVWSQVLRLEQVGIHDNFFALGGDSILSIQIVARAKQAGLHLTPKQIFQHQTIAALADAAAPMPTAQTAQGLVTGALPLTPIQRWFFEQELPAPHHWNQAVLLSVRRALAPQLLTQALRALALHHDALRLRFTREPSGWGQVIAGAEGARVALCRVDVSALADAEQQRAISQAATDLQASLNLAVGPLFRVASFDCGAGQPGRLLILIHHLAIDGVSWRIVLEDLQTIYEQLSSGQAITLPPKTSSFQAWAQQLVAYAQSVEVQQERDYWFAQPWERVVPISMDFAPRPQANLVASTQTVLETLSIAETRALLQEVPAAYQTQINDVLLAALVEAFARWTGVRTLLVDLEGHGREPLFEELDTSRTVGWFTTIFPVLLDAERHTGPAATLKAIKEQLRGIPNRGIGYGVLRYLAADAGSAAQLRALPQAEVSFNYLGQFDQVLEGSALFGGAPEDSGPLQHPQALRSHVLAISGSVIGGQLQIAWFYSENLHRRDMIERVAAHFSAALRELIAHCCSPEANGYTPSDFPQMAFSQQALDDLLVALAPRADANAAGKHKLIEDIYPLTPMQAGMLFHHLYDHATGVYFEQMNCTLRGALDVQVLQRAWQQVIDRHAVLRTAFQWTHSAEPFQVVYRRVPLPIDQHDWRNLTASAQVAELEAFLRADRARSFDLTQAPLMRLALIHTGAESHVLIWSHHHLLLDGWCLPVLLREVFGYYTAFCQGRPITLAPQRPYRDYIAWLQRQDLALAEAYWKQTLAGFKAPTALPIGEPPSEAADPGAAGEPYAEQHIAVSVETTAGLQMLSRKHQITLNTLIQGAWAQLLSRYTGESDVVFGTTVSGRPPELRGVETMIGLFINTLPVRVRVDGGMDLAAWLQRLQADQAEVRQYEYSPLVQVQGWSEVPRGLPLFESLVIFQNYPMDSGLLEQGNGLVIDDILVTERTNYPLTLVAALQGTSLGLRTSYQCSRIDAEAIGRMLRHMTVVLGGMLANPHARVADVPLLTQAEQQQVIVDWNRTATDYPIERTLHELFALQTTHTPDSIALVLDNTQVSYAELDRRSAQLAQHLRCLGIGPEALVGLSVERSPEMLIGLLGILKAGGAYLPLDPAYPSERLRFMLEDAQVDVLITHQSIDDLRFTIDDLGATDTPIVNRKSKIVNLRADWPTIARHPATPPANDRATSPDQLLYAIYTSGSTGRPKGVLGLHRGAVNRFAWMWQTYPFTPGERACQKTSLNFVDSIWEIFGSLLRGVPTVIIPDEVVKDMSRLVTLLAAQHVTRIVLVPALLRALLESNAALGAALPNLRVWITSGEALDDELCRQFRRLLPDRLLLNLYGSSEVAADVTWHDTSDDPAATTRVPIGRPIANTQIYLLDQALRPVPAGVTGEVYAGGAGLARGYLKRPDLTAERFVPNPFAEVSGVGYRVSEDKLPDPRTPTPDPWTRRQGDRETRRPGDEETEDTIGSSAFILQPSSFRLYKTGDLARYRPDGTIIYLGRRDQQVKLRGYRIELGEIEAALRPHAWLQACVVALCDDGPSAGGAANKRLVAYLVPAEGAGGSAAEEVSASTGRALLVNGVRSLAQATLPEYMVPTTYVVLDALPLTPNGKLDRQALPAPDGARPELDTPFEPPQTPTEDDLARIWAEVLQIETVGRQDNFFGLGGHSLKVTQVVSRVQAQFGIELHVRDLFTTPMLRDLAEKIDDALIDKFSAASFDGMLDFLDDIDEDQAQIMAVDPHPDTTV